MFNSLLRYVRSRHRYHASLRELSRLGDRDLADIGLSRSDINRIAWEDSRRPR